MANILRPSIKCFIKAGLYHTFRFAVNCPPTQPQDNSPPMQSRIRRFVARQVPARRSGALDFRDLPPNQTLDFRDLPSNKTLDFRDLPLTHQQAKICTNLLERARVIHRITGVHANGIPLGGDIKSKQTKFLVLDTGLYMCEAKLDVSTWILDAPGKFVNRGMLGEAFVALELLKGASPFEDAALFYWHKEAKNSNAKVDYIVQYRDKVLPIKVKSGNSGSMASLRILMESKGLSLGIRTSEENFGFLDDGRIRIIPLYLIGEYDRILRSAGL